MSLQPVDEVLDAVMKVAAVDERAAVELVRFTLYEALGDQIEQARPRLEQDGVQLLAKRAAQARSSLLRSTVGKALDGVDEPADLDTAAGLAVIDAFVNKSLFGSVLDVFNRKHPHGEGGRFVTTGSGEGNQNQEQPQSSQEVVDARMMFTRARNGLANADNSAKGQESSAAQWNRPGSIGDRQAYRRMSMTGAALSQISEPGSYGHSVGVAAQLAGNIGPEAERVLGPGLRRTAYRYRGTERRPDKTMVADVAAAQSFADGLAGDDPARSAEQTRNEILGDFGGPGQKEAKTPAVGSAANYLRPIYGRMSRDQYELAIRGDTAAIDLLKDIPNEDLTKISIAAGELPPSQGVIIDADGDLTSQAQGYNGDHYLPFDLKNLADLQGGQYVRTRAAGGPTSEDIYTGLLSGARQLQVVSNSGVFTLEFDPDVRGGRRYTDKAARMIGRYSKLLEAIDGGQLYEEDIDKETRRELRQKAYEQTGWDAKKGDERYRELRDEARLKGSYNQEDEDQRFKDAVKQVRSEDRKNSTNPRYEGMSQQGFSRAVDEVVREGNVDAATKRVRRMVLDGKGYSKALLTLKQEFPFYIRSVRYETLPDFAENRKAQLPPTLDPNPFGSDQGYTERGQTNARASLSRDVKGKINDGRLVPTRGEKPAATTATDESASDTTALGNTRSANGQPLKTSVPDDSGVRVTTEDDTVPLADLIAAQPHWTAALSRAITKTSGLLIPLARLEKDGSPLYQVEQQSNDEVDVLKEGGIAWAEYISAKKGEGTAKWLLNEATNEQRNEFVQGFKDAAAELPGLDNNAGVDLKRQHGGNEFDNYIAKIEAIAGLAQPWAHGSENWIEAVPADKYPVPQPLKSIDVLGNKVVNYDKYLTAARAVDPPLLATNIDAFSNVAPDVAPDKINDLLNDLRLIRQSPAPDKDAEFELKKQLGAAQTAWAYVVGRKLAEVVDETPKAAAPQGPQEAKAATPDTNQSGGAGSTRQAPVMKAHQRSHLIFHRPDEAYSQEVRKAFQM